MFQTNQNNARFEFRVFLLTKDFYLLTAYQKMRIFRCILFICFCCCCLSCFAYFPINFFFVCVFTFAHEATDKRTLSSINKSSCHFRYNIRICRFQNISNIKYDFNIVATRKFLFLCSNWFKLPIEFINTMQTMDKNQIFFTSIYVRNILRFAQRYRHTIVQW